MTDALDAAPHRPDPQSPGRPATLDPAHGRALVSRFRWLLAGYSVWAFGAYLNIVAMGLYAYVVTGSPLHTGLVLAVRLAAGFSAGFVSDRLLARFRPKRVMITMDLVLAAALVGLALAPGPVAVVALYTAGAAFGVASTLYNVCLRAGMPDLVGKQDRVRGNAMLVTARSMSTVAGMGAAGVIVAWGDFRAVFGVSAVCCLVSAVNLARLPILTGPGPGGDASPATPAGRTSLGSLAVSAAVPVLGMMIAVRVAEGFGSASHVVGLPVHAAQTHPSEPALFLSGFWVCWAVGNILAQQVLVRWVNRRGGEPGELGFAVSAVLMSAGFITVFSGIDSWLLIPVALLTGVADGYTETAFLSRLQTVSDDRRAKLFGLVSVAETTGLGGGMLVAAALLGWLPPWLLVTVMHGMAICVGLFLLARLTRLPRRRRETEKAEIST
ncbi:putative MFS family arabinose efflux permease [Stackebrandtia albiflava]|uniref:Putative MFS family arabinose efflux permease n=1 Tax=Stackebrandtia albiflava TaxID=406432 RepID=A0A562VAY7_9ACTN|nr:MFS transporter [Stackebrandtia albiflava]TWJ14977.1 putative MFS family arabinose efflux permease [Stackebrandtia albiflava]